MARYEYTHEDWKSPKAGREAGKAGGTSFGRHWLDGQSEEDLAELGIKRVEIPDPDPAPVVVHPHQVEAELWTRIAALLKAQTGTDHSSETARAAVFDGTREAVRLIRKGEDQWTAEEATRAAQLEGLDAAIDALEVKAAALKALDPIPADYTANSHWT